MEIIYVLVGVSVIVAIGFLVSFIWATKSGQYDDIQTPAYRVLFDDTTAKNNERK